MPKIQAITPCLWFDKSGGRQPIFLLGSSRIRELETFSNRTTASDVSTR